MAQSGSAFEVHLKAQASPPPPKKCLVTGESCGGTIRFTRAKLDIQLLQLPRPAGAACAADSARHPTLQLQPVLLSPHIIPITKKQKNLKATLQASIGSG